MSIERTYYENGVLESEVFINNGVMEGQYKSYYNEDIIKPKLFCNYVNGVKHGEEIEYYDNNQIAHTCNYVNGDLHGILKRYYSNGNLECEENYEYNYREGASCYYNKNSLLDEVINYINDSMDGYYYKYNNDNEMVILETKCEYYKDEYMGESLVGDYINYYPNGQIKDICIYEDGRKNGEYKEFYDNGKLKAEGNYEHGNLVGYELRYDIDGNFIEKVFVDDNMDEEEYNKSFKI